MFPATPPSVSETEPGAVVWRGDVEKGCIVISTARDPTTASEALKATGDLGEEDVVESVILGIDGMDPEEGALA